MYYLGLEAYRVQDRVYWVSGFGCRAVRVSDLEH